MDSSETVSRRLSTTASHLGAASQNSSGSSLATMVCSSSTGIQSSRRKDGRVMYARQSSHIPAYLKETKDCQGSKGAGSVTQPVGSAAHTVYRRDSRLMFARQGSHIQAYYMREHSGNPVPRSIDDGSDSAHHLQSRLNNSDVFDKAASHNSDQPAFARPLVNGVDNGLMAELAFETWQTTHVKRNELDWLPRMDISESKAAYMLTIELPGVDAAGIRVEVNNDRLLVSGFRSIDNSRQTEEAFYHRRDLSQGPFKAQWPIPKNTTIDSISAEFIDGFLRILVPKTAL